MADPNQELSDATSDQTPSNSPPPNRSNRGTMTTERDRQYDAKIAPLMTQIIAACHEHKIPMVASFWLAGEEDEGLCCTTALTHFEDTPEHFKRARHVLFQPEFNVLHVTIEKSDGSKEMHAILP